MDVIKMEGIIREYLEQAKISRKQSYKNLIILSLLSTYSLDLEFLLFGEVLCLGEIFI